MAATRNKVVSSAMAVVAVAAMLLLLLVAGASADDCGVNRNQVTSSCLSYCNDPGNNGYACCKALKNADARCLCRKYWSQLQSSGYASCAKKVQSRCGLSSCY